MNLYVKYLWWGVVRVFQEHPLYSEHKKLLTLLNFAELDGNPLILFQYYHRNRQKRRQCLVLIHPDFDNSNLSTGCFT